MSSTLSIARPLALRRSANFALSRTRSAAARRLESTAAGPGSGKDAASRAKDTASRAAQGLSRVTSAAGPAIVGAAKGVTGALGRVGGRTGRLVAFIERQVPFVIYYSRVGLELSKMVFRGQKMNPPSLATFQSYFQNAWKSVQHPSALIQSLSSKAAGNPLQQIRNLSGAQLAAGSVLVAELLGFFTVGEMLGRFKLIGYHGETHSAHH